MGISRWVNQTSQVLTINDINDVHIHLLPGDVIVGDFYRNQSPPLIYLDDFGTGIDLTQNREIGRVIGGPSGIGQTDDSFASVTTYLRDPDISDHQYAIGTLWVNLADDSAFILVASENNQATWQYIGDSGSGGIGDIDGGGFI